MNFVFRTFLLLILLAFRASYLHILSGFSPLLHYNFIMNKILCNNVGLLFYESPFITYLREMHFAFATAWGRPQKL